MGNVVASTPERLDRADRLWELRQQPKPNSHFLRSNSASLAVKK